MAGNHVLLETIQLTQSATSVTFDNLPTSGYTDLKIVMSARSNYASTFDNIQVRFNGVTTGYSSRALFGTGSSVTSATVSPLYAGDIPAANATSLTFGNQEIYIPNYRSSTNKSVSFDSAAENNATAGYLFLTAGLSTITAPITSIELFSGNSQSLIAGSTFSLYGIAALGTTPTVAPKATGGNIVANDGTYWYHAFTTSGAFVPQTNLTADVLVVAGGGGGGYGGAGTGGGGAGGLQNFASQSLTPITYNCVVGSGGAGGTSTNGTQGNNSQFASLTASVGGGYGGGSYQVSGVVGGNGGSGGGAGAGNTGTNWGQAGGSPTTGQGFAGGVSINSGGGGGGGAGEVGSTDGTGHGGDGTSSYSAWGLATLTGQNVSGTYWYAGGGGGATYPSTQGVGGTGGGGNSGIYDSAVLASSGIAGTGGGGGGGGYALNITGTQVGGSGGSGVIIIRYPMAS